MGVYSDKLNPAPFITPQPTGQQPAQQTTQLRIRQKANNARAKGIKQISAFKRMTATGGVQPQRPEATKTNAQMTRTAAALLCSHRRLIDNLVDNIMFG